MTSMRTLNRRLQRWHRYAVRTYWNPRHTRPAWMGPNVAMAFGHLRAHNAVEAERQRRVDRLEQRWRDWSDDDGPRCMLTVGSVCYCTGRPGCLAVCTSCGEPDCDGELGDDECPGDDWPTGTIVETGFADRGLL